MVGWLRLQEWPSAVHDDVARASGASAAAQPVNLRNSTHDDTIELTTIPDNPMVTGLPADVQPIGSLDLVPLDLVVTADFLKAGFPIG